MPLSYRNQSIDLQRKSMNWFLYDNGPLMKELKEVMINWVFQWYIYVFIKFLCMVYIWLHLFLAR